MHVNSQTISIVSIVLTVITAFSVAYVSYMFGIQTAILAAFSKFRWLAPKHRRVYMFARFLERRLLKTHGIPVSVPGFEDRCYTDNPRADSARNAKASAGKRYNELRANGFAGIYIQDIQTGFYQCFALDMRDPDRVTVTFLVDKEHDAVATYGVYKYRLMENPEMESQWLEVEVNEISPSISLHTPMGRIFSEVFSMRSSAAASPFAMRKAYRAGKPVVVTLRRSKEMGVIEASYLDSKYDRGSSSPTVLNKKTELFFIKYGDEDKKESHDEDKSTYEEKRNNKIFRAKYLDFFTARVHEIGGGMYYE